MTVFETVQSPVMSGSPETKDERPKPRATPHNGARYRAVAWLTIPPLLVFVLAICVWLVLSYVLLDERRRFLLPPPEDVAAEGFLDPAALGELLAGVWSTTQVALAGYAIAIVIGCATAVLMSQAKLIERSLYPYAVILQTVPTLALVPLFGFWWGFGFNSRVLVCVTIALFPIITNTLFGLQSVSRELHDLFTFHGAGRLTRLWRLQLPHAVPSVFTGLRISAGLSVIGAIVSDMFFRQGDAGIGRLLDIYRSNLQSEELIAAICLASCLGLAFFWSVTWLGYHMTRHWHPSANLTASHDIRGRQP